MTSPYKNAVCKGSLWLKTGCGHCERCTEERETMCYAQAAAEIADTFVAAQPDSSEATHTVITGGTINVDTITIPGIKIANIGTVTGLPVSGYRKEQPQWAIDLVNENKRLEELILRQIDKHQRMYAAPADGSDNPPQHEPCVDMRNVALARTYIEDAFMRLNRAVFRPKRLEGDLE